MKKADITILLDTAALCALNYPKTDAGHTLTNEDMYAAEKTLGRCLSAPELFRLRALIASYRDPELADAHAARVRLAQAA